MRRGAPNVCNNLLCAPQNNLSTVNLDQNTITTTITITITIRITFTVRFTNTYHILHTPAANATTSAWHPLSHPRTADGRWHRCSCPQPQQSPETATRCRLPVLVPAAAAALSPAVAPGHSATEHVICSCSCRCSCCCCCCCDCLHAAASTLDSSAAFVATDSSPA